MKFFLVLLVLIITAVGCQKSVNATCSDSPKSLKLQNEKSFSVICSSGCGSASIWGTDTYTTDSSICLAAIHAGVIKKESGGKVNVSIVAGQQTYSGTDKNGVKTSSWNSYESSFTVK
jgi:LCCL domain